MNDKDVIAFDVWSVHELQDFCNSPFYSETIRPLMLPVWQAALDYTRKEHHELLVRCEEALATCWTTAGKLEQFYDENKVSETLAALQAAGIGKEK